MLKNNKITGNSHIFPAIGIKSHIDYINKYVEMVSNGSGIGFTTIYTYNGKKYGYNFPATRFDYNLILYTDLNKLEDNRVDVKDYMLGIFQLILKHFHIPIPIK